MRKGAKLAVSDFDRTLYVNESVSIRNYKAVENWQKDGNLFILATGRNESSIKIKLDECGIRPDALILNNGAVILNQEGQELFCKTIAPELVDEILRFLHSFNDDGSGVSTRKQKINVLSQTGTTTQKPCDGTITIDQIGLLEDVVQIHRRKAENIEMIRALCDDLNAKFPAISAYANVWNADIVAKGVNKAAAIDYLIRYFGGFEEVRVIGDSANDVDMIQKYHGAAVREANQEVKKVAAYIVEDVAEYLMMDVETGANSTD